jgi:hypothetical protein
VRRAAGERVVEQLVDEGDEPLPEPSERVVPLAVPVRVRQDVDDERRRATGGR